MNLRKFTLSVLAMLAMFTSCKKDEDDGPVFVEADRTEQQIIDGDSLTRYLETHYYNSGAFVVPGDYRISNIIIKELPKDTNGNFLSMPNPDINTLLIEAVQTETATHFGVSYDYYILSINEGGGERPHFCDNVRLNYSGMMQNEYVFDSTVNPATFDLLNLIQGWRLVIPEFKASVGMPEILPDGTINYTDYGLGVMFLPSGLAYFGNPPRGVNSYANLIFKFELFQTEINDHDNDLVPTYLEDLNGDGNLYNDDTDGDGIPNFLDMDDDGDGVLTKHEDIDNDGDPTNDDTNGNGIPNYLDKNKTLSNQN